VATMVGVMVVVVGIISRGTVRLLRLGMVRIMTRIRSLTKVMIIRVMGSSSRVKVIIKTETTGITGVGITPIGSLR